MSGAAGAWIAAGVAAAAVAGSTMYSAHQQNKAQRRVADQNARQAAVAQKQREEDFRRNNPNDVDVSGLTGQGGNYGTSTMLSKGFNPDDLKLGGGSSLGGG